MEQNSLSRAAYGKKQKFTIDTNINSEILDTYVVEESNNSEGRYSLKLN